MITARNNFDIVHFTRVECNGESIDVNPGKDYLDNLEAARQYFIKKYNPENTKLVPTQF